MDRCGCLTTNVVHIPTNLQNVPYCAKWQYNNPQAFQQAYGCEQKASYEGFIECTDECPVDCLQRKYQPQISYAEWPLEGQIKPFLLNSVMKNENVSKFLQVEVMKKLVNSKINATKDVIEHFIFKNASFSFLQSWVRKNFLQLSVSLERSLVQEIVSSWASVQSLF